MAYDVKVKIDLLKPAGNPGFGYPLILAPEAETAINYTTCKNLSEVAAAGYDTTTDVYKTAELIFTQDNAPEMLAVCSSTLKASEFLSDSANTDKDWRQLLVLLKADSEESINTIAAKIETLPGKMFFANVMLDETQFSGAGKLSLDRTVIFYCDPTSEYKMPVAALVGESAGRSVGSFTYKNLILKGIQPQNLSDTRIEAIHKSGGITFVTKAGDNVTSEGIVSSGEYIDIIDSKDYIIQQITYQVQKLLNSNSKIPYDNVGIAMLEGVVTNVLMEAYNNGMIAEADDGGADYSVSFTPRADTEALDRAARKYVDGKFTFALSGAIHTVEITGEITI